MKAKFMRNFGFRSSVTLLLAAVAAFLAACGGGGGEVTAPPPSGSEIGVAPIIISVTPKSASPDDSITIAGMNFGADQGSSKVTLNGLGLAPTSWSDHEIVATLPADATSGVIVVTVGGRTSRTSENAKIYIGTPPEPGMPLVTGISQPSGEPTDEIIVFGLNFQSPRPDNSRVLFVAGLVEVEADVVPLVGESEGYMWYNTNAKVFVPGVDTGTYKVVVVVAGVRTNDNFTFYVQPEGPPPPNQPPIVDSFSPAQGVVGAIVHIEGKYFGKSRGSSVVQIGAVNMDVILWGDESIYAAVPAGAVPNRIRVMARGLVGESVSPFNVLLPPQITAVTPNQLRIGDSLTIHGKNFSIDGSIHFTPADTEDTSQRSTTVTSSHVTSWTDTLISLDRLPALESDAGVPLDVTVRTDYPSASNAVRVDVVSDMVATLEVKVELNPTPQETVEVEQTVGVAGTTNFKFYGGAGGGSGTYKFVFNFGDGSTPDTHDSVAAVEDTAHIYATDGTYTPTLRVIDQKQARVTVQSRELTIVPVGEPVITGIHVAQLAADKDNAEFEPNKYVGRYFGKQLGDVYCFDDSFIPLISEPGMGLQNLQYAERQYELFAGDYTGRPVAYRVDGGSQVNITGFNLGTAGELYLAVQEDTTRFNVSGNVFDRQEEMWKFTLPPLPLTRMFTGPLEIVPAALLPITSTMPLVAQPVTLSVPGDHPTPPDNTELDLSFNDLWPPADAGEFLGDGMYIFWAFPAIRQDTMSDYLPPAGDERENNTYLLFQGFPVDIPEGQPYIRFDLTQLTNPPWTVGGTQGWPARNPDAGDLIIPVLPDTSIDTIWYYFVWVGARTEAFVDTFANSGIISAVYDDHMVEIWTP